MCTTAAVYKSTYSCVLLSQFFLIELHLFQISQYHTVKIFIGPFHPHDVTGDSFDFLESGLTLKGYLWGFS